MASKVIASLWPNFLLTIALLISAQSCSATGSARLTDTTQDATQKPELPRGEAASYKVQIEVREGKCVLIYDGPFKGQVETSLLAPCEFLRDPAGNIRSLELKNTKQNGGGTYSVIVVIGGPPANEGHSDKYMKNGCGSEVRAVSLSVRGIVLGSRGSGLDICPTSSFDEKLFTADSVHI